MFEPTRPALDPLTMRQVLLGMGKPRPERAQWPTIPRRTVMLLILLGAVMLMGLAARAMVGSVGVVMAAAMGGTISTGTAAATGQGANQEPVKKGSGGPEAMQITPLEKLEIFSYSPRAPHQIFLENSAPVPPGRFSTLPTSPTTPKITLIPKSPADLLMVLVAAITLMLWVYLKAERAAGRGAR